MKNGIMLGIGIPIIIVIIVGVIFAISMMSMEQSDVYGSLRILLIKRLRSPEELTPQVGEKLEEIKKNC